MTGFSCLILFGLSCVVLPCAGQINLPSGGKNLVFAKGSNATIDWSFTEDVKIPMLVFRLWNFINNAGSSKLIARIDNNDPFIGSSNVLPGVITIKKPATLVLENVDPRYDGIYKFTIGGDVTDSSEVTVFIAVPPTVTVECSRVTTLNEGGNFVCTCKGEGGRPPANVTWYDKNGAKIGETGKEQLILRLNDIGKKDRGTYTCEAESHAVAKNKTSIELIVNFPPDNVRVVFSKTMAELGKPFTITCKAEAHPPPKFQIFFNETTLVASSEIYTIPKVNNSHGGFYKCVANNTLGSNNSASQYLRVGNEAGTETSSEDENGLGAGAIVGIVIGVLVLVVIIIGVAYWCKKSKKRGHRHKENTDAKLMKPHGDAHVYDRVTADDGEASTSKVPHEYAVLEPVTYAALDKDALQSTGSTKPNEEREEPTQYASIQGGKEDEGKWI